MVNGNLALAEGSGGGGGGDDTLYLPLSTDEALEIINMIEWAGEDEEPALRRVYIRLRAMAMPLRLVSDNTTSH